MNNAEQIRDWSKGEYQKEVGEPDLRHLQEMTVAASFPTWPDWPCRNAQGPANEHYSRIASYCADIYPGRWMRWIFQTKIIQYDNENLYQQPHVAIMHKIKSILLFYSSQGVMWYSARNNSSAFCLPQSWLRHHLAQIIWWYWEWEFQKAENKAWHLD